VSRYLIKEYSHETGLKGLLRRPFGARIPFKAAISPGCNEVARNTLFLRKGPIGTKVGFEDPERSSKPALINAI